MWVRGESRCCARCPVSAVAVLRLEQERERAEWRAEIAVRRESGSAVSTDWRLQVLPECVYSPLTLSPASLLSLSPHCFPALAQTLTNKSHTTHNFTYMNMWTTMMILNVSKIHELNMKVMLMSCSSSSHALNLSFRHLVVGFFSTLTYFWS